MEGRLIVRYGSAEDVFALDDNRAAALALVLPRRLAAGKGFSIWDSSLGSNRGGVLIVSPHAHVLVTHGTNSQATGLGKFVAPDLEKLLDMYDGFALDEQGVPVPPPHQTS